MGVMRYKVPNPLPLAARLRAVAREEGTRAAFDRVATYGRLQLAQTNVGRAVGFGKAPQSTYPMGKSWEQMAQKGVFFGQSTRMDGAGHLAILAETSLPQCSKYRVHQMAHVAREAGLHTTIADQRETDEALTAIQMASHVMLYRLEPGTRAWMYVYEARRLGLPLLYDIDDPVFSVPAISGAAAHLPAALSRHFADAAPGILALMASCDAISVSTDALAEAVRDFLPRPVFVRRNYADPESLKPLPDVAPPVEGGPGLTLACASGSDGRGGDMAPVLPVIESFLAEDPTRQLLLIGHGFDNHAGLSHRFASQIHRAPFQDYALYLRQLSEADAILVPLADDPFNACKSAVRVLDAAAVARPVVASPYGDAKHVVDHGTTGWLARSARDWTDALAALAASPDRGRSMGARARQTLETHWSVPHAPTVTSPDLLDWLKL